ncbi:hypothetical protein NCER_100445 [Vairimorpha ceranae BRL01]|uniref:RING-type domain-containing protein n=2 Tax=Vairimorpha ceranae TaxID=40302 RepID=C4V7L6_VAIC1|nr:ring u-box domain-containing protein [Vairimorpha ceranae]EEQ82778.1 hypothetical protein NCER_100445 [Vairimorpha ceranae BRL01]KKO75981.1 ring u-box domain-containing protein [Vairimorpha ceranae]
MNSFTPQQRSHVFLNAITMYEDISYTIINITFSFVELVIGVAVLVITRESDNFLYLKNFLFMFSIFNTMLLFLYVSRIIYFSQIIDQPHLYSQRIIVYEYICRTLKMYFQLSAAYLTMHNYVLKQKYKMLYYTHIIAIILDFIIAGCPMLSASFYVLFSFLFCKSEKYETLTVTSQNIANFNSCAICLENYEVDQNVSKLICQHIFHRDCIQEWFQMSQTCPACKKDLWIKLEIYEEEKLKI